MTKKDIHVAIYTKENGREELTEEEWWKYDRSLVTFHREDGPALDYSNESKEWFLNGKLHREDDPAIEDADGERRWYLNGKLHREDEPAIEDVDGSKEWYLNGKVHREDGPAIEYANGNKYWHLNGVEYTEKDHKQKLEEIDKLPLSLQLTHEEQWVQRRANRRQSK